MRHLKTPIEGYEYHIILSEEEKEIFKKTVQNSRERGFCSRILDKMIEELQNE